MSNKKNDRGVLVTPFTHGFDSKEDAIKNIGLVQSYLDETNMENNTHTRVAEPIFAYKLRNGTPHAIGSWILSERTRDKIKDYRTNYYCFNLNDLSNIPPKSLPNVISGIMNGPFRFIQESFSSGDTLSEKKYHLYLPVTELEDVDFEVQQLIYEMVRDDLEIKLGIQLDENTYIHKNILASKNDVHVNEDAPIIDLKPYLNKIKRIERVVKKKDSKVSKEEVILQAVEKEFEAKKINSTVNYKELLKSIKSDGFSRNLTYRERGYLFMVINNMVEDGQINEKQKMELAEVINNG
ncbi:hypothetical protein [Virgibacillus sp. SK37]|uniref:hypothetical protein n=1 Tax=Virgibacillus sp. SK37 TaxID=403957 RepID=UPI0004D1F80A|nr:hypothetical protein [Virgibacillus sp. SK37]AIF45092.1 hypothetical protein X953_01450 [Virgibacillus sp. SK37]